MSLKIKVKKIAAVLTMATVISPLNIAAKEAETSKVVNIYVNGTLEETIKTNEKSTKDLVASYRNETGEDYFLKRGDFRAEVEDNMDLYLISEEVETSVENVEIPFETARIETDELEIGTEKVKTQGVTGMKKVTTKTYYVGGVEEKTETEEKVIIEPLNCEVLVGTKDTAAEEAARLEEEKKAEEARKAAEAEKAAQFEQQQAQAASAAAPTSYSKVLTLDATAYCPCSKCCGKYANGYTANGMKAGYGVVAVDKNVIPLGTKLYVEGYGYCIAADTGSAIKSNRIDLCYDSHSAALASGFGHKSVKVYILD
jgi:3D (Asp-Asp-Asp) domain-containing protein